MMKTLLYLTLTLTGFLFFDVALAGTNEAQLWTTMLSGGTNNLGVLYSINSDGTQGAVAYTFDGLHGANPSGNMVMGPDNLLYGTTSAGGAHGYGVLFSINPVTNEYVLRNSFDSTNGSAPRNLLLGADGNIYGTTQAGGHPTATAPHGAGVLYSYNIVTHVVSNLYSFRGIEDGENPQGLFQANDGNLYGMTRQGGEKNHGVMYSYDPLNMTYNMLVSFNDDNGALPTNSVLMQATNNFLYGTTTWGGFSNMGVVFSYDIHHRHFSKLYDFESSQGSYPTGSLTQANNGILYGVSAYGGTNDQGVIFNYNIATEAYAKLYNFDEENGSVPFGSLIQGAGNLLYGSTTTGGTYGTGVIFNFNLNSNNYAVVSNCDGPSAGSIPMSDLLELQTATTTGITTVGGQAVSLYPNPVNNQLIIQAGDFRPELIIVRDINGQPIIETKFATAIDVSSLAAGVYFVEIKNNNAINRTQFVKL